MAPAVTAVATAVAVPAPPDTSAGSDPLGASVDFAALLAAQFAEAPPLETPLDAAAADPSGVLQPAAGLDLAALLNFVPAIAPAQPQLVSAAPGGAGADALDAAAAGNAADGLLRGIGDARTSLQSDADDAAAKFAVADLPAAANDVPTGTSGESPLPVMQHAGASRNAPPAGPSTPRVDTPFGDSRWATDFGQKVVWLARQDMQSAQISINPPNLGPIDVSLQLGPDQATAVFTSPHADVREALEAALPRLREMLAGAGISLGQAQVGSQAQHQADQQGNPATAQSQRFADGSILVGAAEPRAAPPPRHYLGTGLVDTFA